MQPPTSSAVTGGGQNALKFVRKSDLSQDIFTNRSVISIKGNSKGAVEYKYGANENIINMLA